MLYDHAVIAHGTFYPAGTEVPAGFVENPADTSNQEESVEEKPKRSRKPVQEKAEC